jgi:hypothetical protein
MLRRAMALACILSFAHLSMMGAVLPCESTGSKQAGILAAGSHGAQAHHASPDDHAGQPGDGPDGVPLDCTHGMVCSVAMLATVRSNPEKDVRDVLLRGGDPPAHHSFDTAPESPPPRV